MRRAFYLVFTIVTVSFLIMAQYTGTISGEVYGDYGLERTKTVPFQYLDDEPHFGAITISAQSVMYESVLARVSFNFTINIISDTPVDLTLEQIRFFFTPENASAPFLDEDIPWKVAEMGSLDGILEVANASTVTFRRYCWITPAILEGEENIFLGVVVSFELRNHSSTVLSWYGQGGALHILPVEIFPTYLQSEGWFLGMGGTFLVWGIVLFYNYRVRSREKDGYVEVVVRRPTG
ncbi:MAG: hypothetical protein ACXABD_20530 [Candidatus Thorarchaeota archaeon]